MKDEEKLLTTAQRGILAGALVHFYNKGQTKVSYQDIYNYIEDRSKTLTIVEIEHTMNVFMDMTPQERYEIIQKRLRQRKAQHEAWLKNPKKKTQSRKETMTPEEYQTWLEGQRIRGREKYALKKIKTTGKEVNKYTRRKTED